MRNETKRNIKSGVFIFPKNWIELNSEKAARLENVAFLVEQGKCAVYYSSKEAYALDEVEEKEIRTLGKNLDFLKMLIFLDLSKMVKTLETQESKRSD